MHLEQNSVWSVLELDGVNAGEYRLLYLSKIAKIVIIYPLVNKDSIRKPILVGLEEFDAAVKSEALKKSKFHLPNYQLVSDEELPNKYVEKRNYNFSLIKELVDNPDFLFEMANKKRLPLIKNQAIVKGVDRKKISLLLCQYWYFGQSVNGLLPAYKNSGGPGVDKLAGRNALGAPKKNRTLAIVKDRTFILEDIDKNNIKKSLKEYFLKPKGKSIKESYKEMLRDYYHQEIEVANTFKRIPYVPSYKQYWYWKKKLFSPHQVTKLMKTERDYLQNYRGILGSASEYSAIPGSCFEIDATVADIHIVSQFGENNCLGRPTIYSVVDRASRMIVGFHVSLYNASWRAAQQALAHCFLPKAEYCKRYGVYIEESDWPCAHLPQSLTCDNGEMIGLKPQEILPSLLELHFAPAYRPEMKGIVEQRFRLLNMLSMHHLLGSTRGGQVIRGSRDPRPDSIYTLNEVITILLEAVLEHNRMIFADLAFEKSTLIDHDLSPTPINFWNIHLVNHMHALKKVDVEQVKAHLLTPVKVSMTRKGVHYKNLHYSCDFIVKNKLASVARSDGQWTLDARVVEDITDYIFVRFESSGDLIKCDLLHKHRMVAGLTFSEVDFVKDWADEKVKQKPITVESISAKSRNKKITENAKLRSKENNIPYSKRSKNIKANRRIEIEEMAILDNKEKEEIKSQNTPNSKKNRSDNILHFIPRRKKK